MVAGGGTTAGRIGPQDPVTGQCDYTNLWGFTEVSAQGIGPAQNGRPRARHRSRVSIIHNKS